jgi:uncharacterized Tic20 family protein
MTDTDKTATPEQPEAEQPEAEQPQPAYQQPTQPYPQYAAPTAPFIPPFTELSFDNQRTAGTFAHLISFSTGALGALFGYLTLRHRGGLVRSHYAAALNFQLSFLIYGVVLGFMFAVPILNVLLAVAFLTLRIIFCIVPAKQAHRGELAQIPLTITFVR